MKKNNVFIKFFLIVILLIAIDQISKFVLINNITEIKEYGILGINITKNTGVAFSVNEGNAQNIILTSMILAIVFYFVINQRERIDRKTFFALELIISGGLSNLADRLFRGGVIDFLEIKNFAICNIADIFVFIGWILLIIFLILFNREKSIEVENCKKK